MPNLPLRRCFPGAFLFAAASLAAQTPTLSPLDPAPLGGTWVHDSRRGVSVVLDAQRNTLWEWDGAQFRRSEGPGLAFGTVATYDTGRSAVAVSWSDQLWHYDGAQWRATLRPNSSASARAMAYDEHRGRLVLWLGGNVQEFDGSQWQTIVPPTVPSPTGARMIYDGTGNRCLLTSGTPLQHWHWDGSQWTAFPFPPPAGTAVTYDPLGNRLVAHGRDANQQAATWELLGGTWQAIATPVLPTSGTSLVFDGVGLLRWRAPDSLPEGLARLEGQTWRPALSPQLQRRSSAALASSPLQPGILLFGGRGAQYFDDTWRYDQGWVELNPSSRPSPRQAAQLAYSPANQHFVLYGGIGPNGTLTDTWTFDGSQWTLRANAVPLVDPRRLHTDPRGGVLALRYDYHGANPDQYYWNGSNWVLEATHGSTAPWEYGFSGYDPVRNRIVNALELGSLWEWDGSTWHGIPGANVYATGQPVFDPASNLLVFPNGSNSRGWDGVAWISSPLPTGVQDLQPHFGSGRLLTLTGTSQTSFAAVTTTPARVERFGSGCSFGPAPGLRCELPRLGSTGFAIRGNGNAAQALGLCGLDLTSSPSNLGNGCALWLSAAAIVLPTFTDAGGELQLPIALPNHPAFRGVALLAQVAIVDPLQSPLGTITLSDALRITLGD